MNSRSIKREQKEDSEQGDESVRNRTSKQWFAGRRLPFSGTAFT